MVPVSALNELRRSAIAALEPQQAAPAPRTPQPPLSAVGNRTPVKNERTARFCSPEQITPAAADYFDICYLPLHILAAQPEQIRAIRASL